MALDEHYICQRAANAIISEIGPYRVSTDALQSINQFLDEFIVLLLTCSLSLDLSQIKSVVISLLPSTLGKNAIVEAELEVKTFTETEAIDYDLYEKMRNLGEGNDRFPLDEAVTLLREKCFEYCTLADKDDQLYLQKSLKSKRIEASLKVIISPIVAIYVTTIMEHIAEYLLTAVAMTAEHEDTDYVRVKEVYLALNDDIQLGDVFNRMDLKDKMEKRAGLFDYNKVRVSYIDNNNSNSNRSSVFPQIPTLNLKGTEPPKETNSFMDISFDDLDMEYYDENPRQSTISTQSKIPEIPRPHSAMSQFNQPNRKSTFHLFKNNRNSISSDVLPTSTAQDDEEEDSGLPAMNFDELIKSGGTVKVSLTPNRLRSIEVKDQSKADLSPPSWERRSTSSPRLSSVSLPRPSSPLVRQNSHKSISSHTSNKKATPLSSLATSTPRTSTDNDGENKVLPDVPKLNARPQTPSSPLSKNSFAVPAISRFENPREAPKPPPSVVPSVVDTSFTSKLPSRPTSPSTSSTTSNTTLIHNNINKTPLSKLPTPPPTSISTPISPKLTSSSVSTSVSTSSLKSLSSIVSPVLAHDPMPTTVLPTPAPSTSSTIHSVTEPPIPRPSKSNTINTNGMLIRRSSGSSKKGRSTLRKMKEQETATPPVEPIITTEVTDEPEALDRQVHFEPSSSQPEINPNAAESDSDESSAEESAMAVAGTLVVPRHKSQTLSPERPSSMVAKRASMLSNNRRRSLHETCASEKYQQDVRHRISNVGSVSNSIKQWDDLTLKPDEEPPTTTIPPVSHRRSVLRQLRQQQIVEEEQQLLQEQLSKKSSEEALQEQKTYAVLDKVLKFERASTIADHQRVSHMPRRERFLYLQQDPSAIERKSIVSQPKTIVKPIVRRVIGIDQAIQTEPEPIKEKRLKIDESDDDSEHGEVDGDEEWFLQDSEWDEQEETAIVEWLLGE